MSATACARARHHLAADIDRVDFAENAAERARDPPGSAADFQYAHLLRVLALIDVLGVVEDVLGDGLLAGAEELFVAPFGLAGGDIMASVFSARWSQSRRMFSSCC